MKYLLTVSEHTPTEDGTDLNTVHVKCRSLHEVAYHLENFELNWGVLISATVVPVEEKR